MIEKSALKTMMSGEERLQKRMHTTISTFFKKYTHVKEEKDCEEIQQNVNSNFIIIHL